MRPNVLLVSVDSLRADHVGILGDAPVETPAMDAVGESGTVFEAAYAQGPFTTFSMPSLFTGRYPSALEYVEFSDDIVGVYPGEESTMAEQFAGLGYDTAGFHSNPLLSELFGFDSGFDVFDADMPLSSFGLPGRVQLLTTKLRRLLRRHAYLPASAITDRASTWLDDRDGDDPFFLWTHYMDVHGPYQRKSGLAHYQKFRAERLWQKAVHSPDEITAAEHRELQEAYREEVAYTDRHVGRLLEAVDAATDRETLVVLTADHGDGFDEHGYYSHPHRVDDVLVRVPLLVRDPTGNVPKGRVERSVELVDVFPTLLAAVGASVPETVEGAPLWATGEGDVVVSEGELHPDSRTAFVTGEWKYVDDRVEGTERLYDRSRGEPVDRTAHREEFERFADVASDHYDREAARTGATATSSIEDSEARSRLQDLGYIE